MGQLVSLRPAEAFSPDGSSGKKEAALIT